MKEIVGEIGYEKIEPTPEIKKTDKKPTESKHTPIKKAEKPTKPYLMEDKIEKDDGFIEIRKYHDGKLSIYVEYEETNPLKLHSWLLEHKESHILHLSVRFSILVPKPHSID